MNTAGSWVRHRQSRTITLFAAVGLSLAVAACGSSGAASTSDAAGSSATTSSQVAAARTATQKALAAPTQIGLTTPLKTKPPAGKTFVYLQCELPQCGLFSQGAEAATKALGWTFHSIDFQNANPSTLIAAFKQALQYNPVAVGVSGLPTAVWESAVLPEYQKAGVPIIPLSVGNVQDNNTVISNVSTPADFAKSGVIIADWFIADSGGKGDALIINVPTFDVLNAFSESVASTIKQGCSGCSSTIMNAPITEVESNSLNAAVVAAVQKDPSIKYVITSDGAFIQGLSSSLKAAGVTGVKIAGGSPSITNEQDLLSGTELAYTGQNYSYNGWQLLDVTLRHLEGMPVPANDGGSPQQLLTKANVGTPSVQMNSPANYPAQFEKLWLIG